MNKYCSNCGAELKENADVCLSCGVLVEQNKQVLKKSKDGTACGIIGLCFALFIPFLTWIMSGIGYSNAKKTDNKNAKKMNLIALIISFISMAFYIMFCLSRL